MNNGVKKFKGHHGSTASACKKIRNTKFNITYLGWLGSGVYFFEDDSKMAHSWAVMHCGCGRKEVLECIITVEEDNILDVSDPKSIQNKNFNEFKEVMYEMGMKNEKLINPKDKNFEAKVIDLLCKKDGYDLVRNFTHTFTENDRRCSQINSKISNGVELCVNKLECIEII